MDSNQLKALKKDANDKLLDLTAVTYKDGKEQSNWIEFLKSGMFTYKYPFSEQLQIHAQTQARDIRTRAVADLKIWKMFGYRLKPLDIEFYGEPENAPPTRKPIEVLDSKNKVKQVYDISQMERRDGKDKEIPFKLWDKNLTPDKADNLKAALIEKYGLKYEAVNESSLSFVLFSCLEEKFKRILDENESKFAVGENISKRTYEEIGFTAFVSAQIMIMARLGSKAGINNDEVLSFYKMIHDKLPMINTKGTLIALGELTNAFAKEMFTEIEIIVKKQERELKIAREGLSHEQTGLDNVGQNAAGISEGVQPRGVSEVDGAGVTDNSLHRNTEPNAEIHREHGESDTSVPDRNGANARQSAEPIGMDTGNEQHTADGEGNSHQGTDRRQSVDEKEETVVPSNTANNVVIGSILGFDPAIYSKPWICAVSRGKNYFATKEGTPIGGFTGNATDGTGGDIYVINPQEGRIYGYGHKNKEDNSKSLTVYAKYQDGGFLPCDRNGNLLEVNADIEENIEPESKEPESKEPENKTDAGRESEQTPETAPPINEPSLSMEDTVLAPESQNHTEPTAEAELPLKTEWEKYIEKRTTGIYAKQYTEPIVLIEFSENPSFGGKDSLNFQGYEELSFTQADRKFKEVEAEARTERIKQYGKLGGYDKTYGVILYKDHPEDEELSTYKFRYDICDYDEEQTGLFNHINGFWQYQAEKMQKNEFTGYQQDNVDNVKRMLSILEPYSAHRREARLKSYFKQFPPYRESHAVGEKVLLPMLFENGNLNRKGKRTYVTVEEHIGKYQIYSEGGENDNERYAFIMTPANKLINIAALNQIKGEHINRIELERLIDDRIIIGYIDQFNKNIQDPAAFIDYRAAAVMNLIADAETHNAPVVEARQRKHEEENKQREEERKAEELRIAQEKAQHEDLGGFGDDGSMTPLQKSKVAAFLKDNQYPTRDYGYLSNKEFVEKVISDGYIPEKRVSLKKKYAEMLIGDDQDGTDYSKKWEARRKIGQIEKENLGLDSPQAGWLKVHSPLTYYKVFKNRGLNELAKNGADFLESPEMKPFVTVEYAFSKPLEKEGHFSTYSKSISKTHFDYGEFLMKQNRTDIEDIAKEQELGEIDEPQTQQAPAESQELQTEAAKANFSQTEPSTRTEPVTPNGIFNLLPERHANADVKGKYSDTHFRIRKNGYDSSGRTEWEESTRIAYENEVKKILTDNGWNVQQGIGSGRAATATKGKNYLYLHPQDFSGVCENDEREILRNAFSNSTAFVCESIDVYKEIHDMTDEDLNDKLNNERETIETELLEALTTKRSNLYITSVGFFGVDGSIGKRHSVKRLAIEGKQSYHGVDDRTDGICATFANEVFKSLVDNGKIVSSKTKSGIGYRKATEAELNQIQLSDFTFQEPEVKQESLWENNEEAIDQTTQTLIAEIREDLSSRGFAVSDELIVDGISEARSHGVTDNYDDIADFIENEYLTEEPEAEQEQDLDIDETIPKKADSKIGYAVGDTVYLERFNKTEAYIVKEINENTVKIIDPSYADPIMEELNKTQFTNLYYGNPLNNAIPPIKDLPADKPTHESSLKGNFKWREYQMLAREHADKILFVQTGDFYEVLGDNADVVAKALNINTTGRDVGLPERVSMCGVPNYRLDEYTALLNQSGYSVAVKNNDGTINIYANEVAERSEPYTQTEDIGEQKKYNLDIFPMGGNGIIVYNRLETDMSKYQKGHVLLSDIENDIGIIAHIHHERNVTWHSENIPNDIKDIIEGIARVSDNERLAKRENNQSNLNMDEVEETPIAATPELPQNYRLNEQLLNRTSFGEKSRFKDNIQAIKTLKLIETENRAATNEEQDILSKYAGWGGISQAFNKDNPSWNAEYAILKEVLTEQEYREAQSSTLSAFYTNPTVIKAMYEALESIGVTTQSDENEKLNILEPALGVGNFFGMMPDELQGKANLHGIELDSISARIAQKLYPQANIQNTGYEETYAKDYFDLVIGNVPFGDFKLIDKQNPEISQQNFRIHDHFFSKALDQVKPGGVVAFITSSGTMDKETTKTRRYIAERAELLGAVRLPNNAFKGIANTEVTSDIIFLQRRAEPLNLTKIKEQAEREGKDGEEAIKQICPWIFTSNVSGINKINGEDVPINSYFINNPQMVLGEMIVDNGNRMHGALIPTCKPSPDMDLTEQLKTAMSDIKTAESITTTTQGYIGTFDVYEGLKTQAQEDIPIINTIPRNFSYVLGNEGSSGKGKIFFYETQGKPLEDVTDSFTDLQRERMTGLIDIKDTCRALIEAQLNNHSDDIIKGLQVELNERYDTYTGKHGLINGRAAKQLFAEDSSYPLLCALEVLDTDGEFISKSEMFFKRTINPVIEITHADTAEEALILSMSERGAVDVAYMEKLTGRTENDLFSELVGLGKVYKDLRYPIGENNYEYRTVDEFLSGNVRMKLSKAESLLGELEELRRKENLTPEEQLKNRQIQYLTEVFDVDEQLLKSFVESDVTERNINEYGRFSKLMASVDRFKAKIFFDKAKGENIQMFRINAMTDALFRDFILNGKFDLKLDDTAHDIETAENSEAKAQRYAEILANIETLKYNITVLEKSVPKQLESSDIDVRFGSTWIPPHYIGDFISEKLNLSDYAREGLGITYDKRTSTWGKNQKYTHVDRVLSTEVYGTKRIDAIDIMLDSLNLKDVKIYDPHPDDSKRRVLNYKETVLAQNVQKKIKKEFLDWIWDKSERRADLVEIYNRQFNSITPREYDGSNLRFTGMSPEVKLKPHQKNAVARILYGGNTLLAHEVGLGKTYEMIAAAMESKRLGLCNKSLVTVPKHLTEQFGSDFLKVYPNANVLIVRENDFTPQNRKKFCAKIATGNYDAIIIAHSQFEKIPLSKERQEKFIQDQLDELEYARDEEDSKDGGERNNFTIKQLEKRKKQLEAKLDELVNQEYKDDTIDFEELGIDRLFVDEAHFMKNLYFPTKLTGVAGLSKSESNRATDMFMKVRYLDEITGNKGTIFATGTLVYTLQQ